MTAPQHPNPNPNQHPNNPAGHGSRTGELATSADRGNNLLSVHGMLSPAAADVAHRCREHLERERDLLQQYIRLSESIHESLGQSMFPELQPYQDQQQQLLEQASDIAGGRQRITEAIARLMHITPGEATVRRFAEALPSEIGQPLMQQRDDLLALQSQIDDFNRRNAVLLQQSVDIYRRIILAMSGQSPAAQTYSATGQVSPHSGGHLVYTDC